MNDGFTADTNRLATQAGQFGDLAGRVEEIHRTLAESLTATGQCWGTDEAGQSFGAAHASPADGTMTQLSGLSSQLGDVGTRFTDTAATYTGTDEAGAEHLRATDPGE